MSGILHLDVFLGPFFKNPLAFPVLGFLKKAQKRPFFHDFFAHFENFHFLALFWDPQNVQNRHFSGFSPQAILSGKKGLVFGFFRKPKNRKKGSFLDPPWEPRFGHFVTKNGHFIK